MDMDDVRSWLAGSLVLQEFVTDKSGVRTVEMIGSSFVIGKEDEPFIFGEVNLDYAQRELQWYESQSLYVKDIPGKVPAIWEQVASREGKINSNYGFLIWSYDNYHQYANVLEELRKNPNSRRAVMIYTRPSMHYDYSRDGMSDFICTNTVQYLVRDGELNAIVNMRSNDAVFGFRNDYHWQRHVLEKLAADLSIEPGSVVWQCGSLHVYERHFYLLDHYNRTGEPTITKERYRERYQDSPWSQ
jgi:thymidylate synthase